MVNVFNVPGKSQSVHDLFCNIPDASFFTVFFITLRECLETAVIVSVLLAFINQTLGHDQDPVTYKKLVRQVSAISTRTGW